MPREKKTMHILQFAQNNNMTIDTTPSAKKTLSSCDAKFSMSNPMGQGLQRVLKDPGNRYPTPEQVLELDEIFLSSGLTPAKLQSACY